MTASIRTIRDRVIVVAGATTPVGAAAARAAAGAGARVLLIAADEALLGEAVRAINNAGGRADYAVAAAGNAAALAAAGRVALGRFGRVDDWLAEASDAAALGLARDAAAPLLQSGGGTLVVAAGGWARQPVETMRAALRAEAPGVALTLVTASAGTAPDAVAAAMLAAIGRPGRDVAANPALPRGFAARHPRLVAAIGVGGLALAVGAIARRRRGRTA